LRTSDGSRTSRSLISFRVSLVAFPERIDFINALHLLSLHSWSPWIKSGQCAGRAFFLREASHEKHHNVSCIVPGLCPGHTFQKIYKLLLAFNSIEERRDGGQGPGARQVGKVPVAGSGRPGQSDDVSDSLAIGRDNVSLWVCQCRSR
jgi:hypothetical protein